MIDEAIERRVDLPAFGQTLARVGTHRLEQSVARALAGRIDGDERPVDQALDQPQRLELALRLCRHAMGRVEIEGTRHHAEPVEERGFVFSQQVVAPLDRVRRLS